MVSEDRPNKANRCGLSWREVSSLHVICEIARVSSHVLPREGKLARKYPGVELRKIYGLASVGLYCTHKSHTSARKGSRYIPKHW